MYYIVTEQSGKFHSYHFENSVVWEKMIASVDGGIVELFRSDSLEPKDFEDFFFFTYVKKQYGKSDNTSKSETR